MAGVVPYIVASWRLPANLNRGDTYSLGGKAVGLLRLPSEWVPPFVIFTKEFCELLQQRRIEEAFALIPADQLDLFQSFLSSLSKTSSRAFVRSNAPGEEQAITSGKYLSKATDANLASVAECVDQICNTSSDIVYCLVQECIEPSLTGHMSNERRVSFERSLWLVEGLSKTSIKVLAQRGEDDRSLLATNENGVLKALRKVAGRLATLEQGYFHCEWTWTGTRVWVVQADARPPMIVPAAANEYIYLPSSKVEPFVPTTSRLTHFLDVTGSKWKKLTRPVKFHELGLPHADIYIITGEDWSISSAENFLNLLPDLTNICREPVVIRCDIAEDVQEEDLFLPTSPPTNKPDKLIGYMDEISKFFIKRGIDEKKWAFLLARVVQAKASAMIHARPGSQQIQVDALWGFPDGLLYYPHDTYYYDCTDGSTIEKRRFKGFSLICSDEKWVTLPVNPPLDWGHVLSSAEVEILAKWALALADSLEHEVQLMGLVRISGQRGLSGCLPWHYNQLESDRHTDITQQPVELQSTHVVSSREDLYQLQIAASVTTEKVVDGFLIRPNAELLRDDDFLNEAASWAAKAGIPIYFQGSLLGHAYYRMAKTGATVIPLSETRPAPKITRYGKIVRDLIPAIIQRAGGIARVRTLPLDEAITLLAQKLIEESFEVWQADREHLAGELADILEVIDALRQHAAIPTSDLDKIRENKRRQRGGFQDLVFLEETANRPLELADSSSGTLPLLMEDSLSVSKQQFPTPTKLPVQIISAEFTKGPKQEIKITVPLVPPIKRGHRVNTLVSRSGDYRFHVMYDNAKLIITMSQVVEEPPAEQLRLFDTATETEKI